MRPQGVLAWPLAIAFVFGCFAFGLPSAPASAAGSATLSPEVTKWLSSAASAGTFKTIITLRDAQTGFARLDTTGVASQRLGALPIAFANLSAARLSDIASWPETRSLWHDAENRFVLDESVPLIGANTVRAGTGLRRPYTGAGVSVAVIDTGVDSTHPDLPATKTRTFVVAGDAFDRDGVIVRESPTVDTYGHGTHVSSTIAGTGAASAGRYTGVAPGATIYAFKTDVGAVLIDSWALRSFDWILTHPEANIRVSSNSWGSGDGTDYNADDPINVTTKILYERGITVVFAEGNSGGPDTINQFATSPWVIGAASGTKDRKLSDFSSRGRISGNWDRALAQSTNTGLYRPTVTAPGTDIEAAKSTQAVVMADGTDPENPFYTTASGTSMATPHVAGTVALMLEARPKLTPAAVIAILEGTAVTMTGYEVFEVGRGYIDAYAATLAAERGKTRFKPSAGQGATFTQVSETPFSGIVPTSTWLIRECPDSTGLLQHHRFDVGAGLGAVYAEVEWDSETQLIYLVLYGPSCEVLGESANLLDIGSVTHRALVVTNPAPGTYTVAVYGRINVPTPYRGAFSTYTKS
ncbi:MAG TPA: S8 family serine peptidase [Candidatus Limnocylindria bacterium]|jgi:serine protease AprX|nr:S8 family serine peptidase [Candidatus Limnocylindria bacterium]